MVHVFLQMGGLVKDAYAALDEDRPRPRYATRIGDTLRVARRRLPNLRVAVFEHAPQLVESRERVARRHRIGIDLREPRDHFAWLRGVRR